MRRTKRDERWWRFLLLFAVFWFAGCAKLEEGCLDIEALNFKVDADKPCSGCCVYPSFRLDLQHKAVFPAEIKNFILEDSVYFDDNGNPFRVRDIQFYISNVHLVRADGEEIGVSNERQIEVVQQHGSTLKETIEDNFALIRPDNFQIITLGNIRTSGSFTGIRFTLGIEGIANKAGPSSFPDNHPLAIQEKEMYPGQDSGYLFNRIELLRNTADTTVTILKIGGEEYLRTVDLSFPVDLPEGFNRKVVLRIDYLSWFAGVDIRQATEEELISGIVNRVAQSFFVVDIAAE